MWFIKNQDSNSMSKKYPGHNPDDTFWDDYHRKNGMMTNNEFFTSNAEGGFYEGMEYDEDAGEWVPNAETRQREYEREKANECPECGADKRYCWC